MSGSSRNKDNATEQPDQSFHTLQRDRNSRYIQCTCTAVTIHTEHQEAYL